MSKKLTIGLFGYGVVGTGLYDVLHKSKTVDATIKKIVVKHKDKPRNISQEHFHYDKNEILQDEEINLVVELIDDADAAFEIVKTALENGKAVVSANKKMIAEHFEELYELQKKHQVPFLYEAAVCGSIPIIRNLEEYYNNDFLQSIQGIVNGSTNYILTKTFQDNLSFDEALKEAQEKGYAESDPTADVGGLDAARKLAILSSIAFNTKVSLNDVYVEGITKITPDDIKYAKELGYVVKLLAIAKDNVDNGIEVRVHPAFISNNHPLSAVNDVFNAIYINGNAVGEAMFYGRGAGSLPTASAVVADVIDVARNIVHDMSGRILCTCFEDKKIASIDESISSYYIRLLVKDEPGVLALIAGAFGDQKVSLGSVIQKQKLNNQAELVLLTGAISDVNIQKALTNIKSLNVVTEVYNVIRVEE